MCAASKQNVVSETNEMKILPTEAPRRLLDYLAEHYESMLLMAYNMTGNWDDAAELLQDVAVRIGSSGYIVIRTNERTLLRGVMAHVWGTTLRRKYRERRNDWLDRSYLHETKSPEAEVDAREFAKAIGRHVDTLSDAKRDHYLVWGNFGFDCSHEEMASVSKISIGASRAARFSLLAELRDYFASHGVA